MAYSWKEVADFLGTPFATAWDTISGGFISRNKIAWGSEGVAQDVSEAKPLPVAETGQALNFTDSASTVTTGGSPQTILTADVKTRYARIQNKSAQDIVVRNTGDPASSTAGDTIAPGMSLEYSGESAPKAGISLFGSVTGQAFYLVVGKIP